ncbi:hypothetical protein [Candidatus Deferrimicrobium sp.]|uniref:hypothetical protein n=1 Tax=Candidatus Deferrimicrobium sp. TaxID=3060586 RepID=UPI002ED3A070
MGPWIPQIDDVLTAVISLACRGGEQFRMHRVYSALSELKPREALLSGLFSPSQGRCATPGRSRRFCDR